MMTQTSRSQDDSSARQSLENEYAQTIMLYFLDGYLCLAPEQHQPILDCLNDEWPSSINRGISYLISNGPDSSHLVTLANRDKPFEKILTKSQRAIFDELDLIALQISKQLPLVDESLRQASEDPIRLPLKSVAEIQLDYLTDKLSLTPKQQGKLVVAKNGAIQSVLAARKSLFENADGNRKQLWNTSPKYRTLMDCPLSQFEQSSLWKDSIKQVLTLEQFAKFQELQEVRSKLSIHSGVSSLILTAERDGFHCSIDELEKLVRYMSDELQKKAAEKQKLNQPFGHFEVLDHHFEFSQEELQKILTEKNWIDLRGQIHQERRWRKDNGDDSGKEPDERFIPKERSATKAVDKD